MSAAGRGSQRIENDNYPTPSWATRRILEALWPQGAGHAWVLEPCAGEGAIVQALAAYAPLAVVERWDVRALPNTIVRDAARPMAPLQKRFDLLITNPPFNVAHEIIQAQRETAEVACYLLRASFLEGERAESYRGDMPNEFRLPERPNFVASSKCKGHSASKHRTEAFIKAVNAAAGEADESHGCGWSELTAINTPRFSACPSCGGRVQVSTSDASAYSWFVWTRDRRSYGETRILPSTPLAERRLAKQ